MSCPQSNRPLPAHTPRRPDGRAACPDCGRMLAPRKGIALPGSPGVRLSWPVHVAGGQDRPTYTPPLPPATRPEAPDDDVLHYRDDGCDIAPRCLDCPLPLCRFDLPPKVARTIIRETELRVLLSNGKSAEEAAAIMGMSRRSVFRLRHYAATSRAEQILQSGLPVLAPV